MAKVDLTKYGITGTTELVYNPSFEFLFEEEMKPELEGFDKGVLTELDAVNVMTGIYTGRSPKDKYIVMDARTPRTLYGGRLKVTRTTTTRCRKTYGQRSRRSPSMSSATRDSS